MGARANVDMFTFNVVGVFLLVILTCFTLVIFVISLFRLYHPMSSFCVTLGLILAPLSQ